MKVEFFGDLVCSEFNFCLCFSSHNRSYMWLEDGFLFCIIHCFLL